MFFESDYHQVMISLSGDVMGLFQIVFYHFDEIGVYRCVVVQLGMKGCYQLVILTCCNDVPANFG